MAGVKEAIEKEGRGAQTQKLGRYCVYGTLAKGTFSRVRYCTAGDTNESFALRIIDRSKIEQEGLLENLKNEITIMKMLDHRCVINVKDMLASSNRIFLVLDLMMGGNLHTKVTREGYLNESESRFYFQQIFCGLEYLHRNGIVHGNLRCENCLLHPDGALKVGSLGLGRQPRIAHPIFSLPLPPLPSPSHTTSVAPSAHGLHDGDHRGRRPGRRP